MPNRFTRGKGIFGKLWLGPNPAVGATLSAKTHSGVVAAIANTVARTDTAAKNLFNLAAHAIIDELVVFGPAVSNAGTTATLSVGKAGSNTFFLNAFDVKGATGAGQQVPAAAANLGDIGGAALAIVGIYAETGAASTLGGPWTVTMLYHFDV